MSKSFVYQLPTQIIFGQNTLAQINQHINHKKTLLITSEGFIKRGLVQKVQELAPSIVHTVTNIPSHPDLNALEAIYNALQSVDYDLILAIGGGSVIDAAKVCAVFDDEIKHFDLIKNLLVQNKKQPYQTKPIIALPTTAGTASEITPFATVWDMENQKKYSLNLPELFCKTAIYDPVLTRSLPKEITIQCALDTLSHALESIWNFNANTLTVGFARKAIQLILCHLPNLIDNLDNVDLREQIMLACLYAGMAFSNTKTAIAHAMSYYFTAHHQIPHGIACSITLPVIIAAAKKYPSIYTLLENTIGTQPEIKMLDFFNTIQVETDLKAYGISTPHMHELADALVGSDRINNSVIKYEDLDFNQSLLNELPNIR